MRIFQRGTNPLAGLNVGRSFFWKRIGASLLVVGVLMPAVPASAIIENSTVNETSVTTVGSPSTEELDNQSAQEISVVTDEAEEVVGDSEAVVPVSAPAVSSIIVKLVAGLDSDAQAAVIARHGGVETSAIAALRLHVVEVPTADLDTAIASYRADADVASVSVDRVREVEGAASDPGYGSQWALPQIGWDQVHGDVDLAGSVTIAVLDTGVAAIDELEGRLGAGYSAFGTNPTNDVNGHGTQMASIAAAATNNGAGIAGVAYGDVTVLPVQVLDANGEGSDSDIIEGLVWAVDNGADVALMAFSNPGYSPALQDAINYAWYNGVVVVAAAGNDGSTSATYPAGSSKVIGVGGSTSSDTVWASSNQSAAVYLTAPAVGISAVDANGDVVSVSGTSASAAIVAGAAAVLRGADASATNSMIVGRLARNAEPLVDSALGNGRVDLARAVADTSTEGVTPMGVAGSGGPIVGPYTVASTATVKGKVTVSGTTTAIESASVICFNGCTAAGTVTTSATGDYTLEPDFTGNSASIVVRVTKAGYRAVNLNLTVNKNTVYNNQDVSLVADSIAPTVSSIDRVGSATTNGTSVSWTVTFSEAVTGVNAADFSRSLTGTLSAGTPSVTGSGAVYTVTVASLSGDGDVQLNVLDDDSVIDLASNALGGTGSGNGAVQGIEAAFTVDRTAPTVSSISRVGSDSTSGSSVSWTVTFSEAVTGVDTTDFSRTVTGDVASGLVATWTVSGSGSTRTVTVPVSGTNGTIQLNVVDNDSIVDAAGSALRGSSNANGAFSGTSAVYTIDNISPTVSSVVRVGDASRSTSSMSWTVQFSESVTGVDASDFAATITSGDLVVDSLSLSGSGATYTVSTSRTSGQGTVRLDVSNNGAIEDAGGLDLSAAFSSGDTITFDSVAPTVSLIVIPVSAANPTGSASVSWTVTFSEPVTGVGLGVNITDFSTSLTGSLTAGSPSVSGSGSTYTVTVGSLSGSGTIQLNVLDDDSIVDSALNKLGGTGSGNGAVSGTGAVYTVDQTAPTVSSIVIPVGAANPTGGSSVSWTVSFSESVTGVDAADFTTTVTGTVVAGLRSVTGSGSTWTVTVPLTGTNGTIRLNLVDDDTIVDSTSNKLGGTGTSGGNNGSFQGTGSVYTIDRAAPRVSSIAGVESSPTSASTVSWTVIFSKAVSGVDTTDFQLAPTGGVSGASISSVTVSPSGSQPASTFVVTASTGTGSGTLGLNLVDNDSIIDDGAQLLVGAGSALDGSVSGPTFTLDRDVPTVSSIAIPVGAANPSNASSVSWTVTFSESVTGVGLGVNITDFSTSLTGSLTAGSPSVSGSGSTYTVTVGSLSGEGTIRLNVLDDDSIVDVTLNTLGGSGVGNGSLEGTSAIYTVDKSSPVTQSIVRHNGSSIYTAAQEIQWLVTFNEPVKDVDPTDFKLYTNTNCTGSPSGVRKAAIKSVAAVGGTSSSSTWIVTVDTGTRNGQLCLDQEKRNFNTLSDAAGNIIASNYLMSVDPRFDWRYVIEKNAPFVKSIKRDGASEFTKNDSETWMVTFSEAVGGDPMLSTATNGVTAEDFCLSSGVLCPLVDDVSQVGVDIDSVVPVDTSAVVGADFVIRHTEFLVTGDISSFTEGDIWLHLVDNDTIFNASEIELRSSESTRDTMNIVGSFFTGESYTIDRTAPVVSVENVGFHKNNMTQRPFKFEGTFELGESSLETVTVEVFDGSTLPSGASPVLSIAGKGAGNANAWSSSNINKTDLSEGPHTAYVTQTDKAGNSSTVSLSFLVDDTVPLFPDGPLSMLTTNEESQVWEVEDPKPAPAKGSGPESGLRQVICVLNDDPVSCSSLASPSNASAPSEVNTAINLEEGCNTLVITVGDQAANQASMTWFGVLDTNTPDVQLDNLFEFFVADGHSYTNSPSPVSAGSGEGNVADRGCESALDLSSPSDNLGEVILKIYEGQMYEADFPDVESEDVDTPVALRSVEINLVDSEEVFPMFSPDFSAPLGEDPAEPDALTGGPLPEGWYSLRAEQSDSAGNVGYSSVVRVLIDRTDPEVTITPPSDLNDVVSLTSLRSNLEVGFSPSDPDLPSNTAGSGIRRSECSFNGGDWLECDDEFVVTETRLGTQELKVRTVDKAGNSVEKSETWNVRGKSGIFFNGTFVAMKDVETSARLSASVTSAFSECSNPEVTFTLSGTTIQGTAYASTSPKVQAVGGVAVYNLPLAGVDIGVYDVWAETVISDSCSVAAHLGSLTVANKGAAASGGGWYQSNGRTNFGFTVSRVPNTLNQFRGQVLIQNNGKWRFKGTIDRYVKLTSTSGTISGTGVLQRWDGEAWQLVSTGVAFSARVEDLVADGARKGADRFTVNQIGYNFGTESSFVSLSLQNLRGGGIRLL